MSRYDIIVLGLGAMGSACAAELASRGSRVLGLDRFLPPHDRGSSHGETRVIREAYWEHPLYVPLVQRSAELWRRLERDSGRALLRPTGALLVGREEGVLIAGSKSAAAAHGLAWDYLESADIRRRFPCLRPDGDTVGIFEPRAGALFPEACIETMLQRAAAQGADLRFDRAVTGWRARDGAVEITSADERVAAERLIVCAGAWLPTLVAGLPLVIERQVLHWLAPADRSAYAPESFPIFLFEEEGGRHWYGLPDFGSGLKVAIHHDGAVTTADGIDRAVAAEEIDEIRALAARRLVAAGEPARAAVCMYTNTPDSHFVLDEHPDHPEVLLVSACSGHGFKFAAVIGELVADLVTKGRTEFDLEPFRCARFAPAPDQEIHA